MISEYLIQLIRDVIRQIEVMLQRLTGGKLLHGPSSSRDSSFQFFHVKRLLLILLEKLREFTQLVRRVPDRLLRALIRHIDVEMRHMVMLRCHAECQIVGIAGERGVDDEPRLSDYLRQNTSQQNLVIGAECLRHALLTCIVNESSFRVRTCNITGHCLCNHRIDSVGLKKFAGGKNTDQPCFFRMYQRMNHRIHRCNRHVVSCRAEFFRRKLLQLNSFRIICGKEQPPCRIGMIGNLCVHKIAELLNHVCHYISFLFPLRSLECPGF